MLSQILIPQIFFEMPTIGTIVKIVTFVKIVNNFQYTRHCRFSLLFIAIHIFLSLGFPYWTDFKQSVFFGLRQYVTNTWFYLVNWCTDNCSLILSALAVRAFHNIWDNNDNHIWDFIWNAFVAFFIVLYTCLNSCVTQPVCSIRRFYFHTGLIVTIFIILLSSKPD